LLGAGLSADQAAAVFHNSRELAARAVAAFKN